MFLMFQRRESGPDLETASAVVSGAGTATANGTYTRDGSLNSKPRYAMVGGNTITWSGVEWEIFDDANVGGVAYFSADNVAYPWLATTWEEAGGNAPAPTVAIG